MVVVLARTKPPTQIDTVEALCDAIIRQDEQTQVALMGGKKDISQVTKALEAIAGDHKEIATSYNSKVIKEYDDANASYSIVEVPLNGDDNSIYFTCCLITNQWSVLSVHTERPNIIEGVEQ